MEVGNKRNARDRWRDLSRWVKGRNPAFRGIPRRTPRMSYRAHKAANPISARYHPRAVRNRQLGGYRRWFRNTRRTRYKRYQRNQRGFYK